MRGVSACFHVGIVTRNVVLNGGGYTVKSGYSQLSAQNSTESWLVVSSLPTLSYSVQHDSSRSPPQFICPGKAPTPAEEPRVRNGQEMRLSWPKYPRFLQHTTVVEGTNGTGTRLAGGFERCSVIVTLPHRSSENHHPKSTKDDCSPGARHQVPPSPHRLLDQPLRTLETASTYVTSGFCGARRREPIWREQVRACPAVSAVNNRGHLTTAVTPSNALTTGKVPCPGFPPSQLEGVSSNHG